MSKQFMEDAQGRQVPVSMIKKFDLKRNDLVCSIMERTFAERERLAEFKRQVWEEIQAFVDESAKDSGAKKLGGKKGNITLTSFDGRYKLIVAVNDGILFNEKLQIAKQLIDECIGKWSKNARPELKVLVDDAFNVGKNGLVSTGKVLGLRRLNITDATWRRAMDAITESIQVVSSKTYMRFYERQEDESYKQIPLDVASL
ncbi:PF11363 family protein [Treponema socranskii subsp. socranskii VPI DR56BR1116 = ATCC 35536]|uniref:PF11363 family protein n=1 Tax=Treponema socranskii subsp. socranskii VPI DR56BR1116 = ATCC 35536 TaxID=1125725 RepID=U2MFN8_TRESO|nr:DUF3164 family protein [Treponema socranskii]ERF61908.1 PF11363 family protein [Treponema socranskii subsp. socranskii VPI DR56BR1116 = ATCC 35536]ERK00480.1 PF11363 family protein [Treponema socranskii subsp. socranskii VPI DR56BR1116 = ATCC 35536]